MVRVVQVVPGVREAREVLEGETEAIVGVAHRHEQKRRVRVPGRGP